MKKKTPKPKAASTGADLSKALQARHGAVLEKLADKKLEMDGRVLLRKLPDGSVRLVFFDPQYRGVMEHLQYGNEGARQKGRASLVQMPEEVIAEFVQEIDRVLAPTGHLMLWVDKFHLVQGVHPWLNATALRVVDLVTWDKARIGMGYRTRRRSEYLVVLQKEPTKAKGFWTTHDIPDVWMEKVGREHPHCKPVSLQAALIGATSTPGDFVVDPAAGGFSVMRAAASVGRRFIGCDIGGAG